MKIEFTDQPPSLDDMLGVVRQLLNSPNGARLWDVLTAMRGPDCGEDEVKSERPIDGIGSMVYNRRYKARVNRKLKTVAVLRGKAFGSVQGARVRNADHVVLPPEMEWDHFDKHVARAAGPLGLRVVIDSKATGEPVARMRGMKL